jgi:hypothetical protein
VVANPIIEQCVSAILRGNARLGFFNGNCAMPGSGTQKLHMDGGWTFPSPEAAADAGEPWPHRCQPVQPAQLVRVACATTSDNPGTK